MNVAGILFILAGLIWISNNNIPIGMMFICIGIIYINSNKKAGNNLEHTDDE